MSDVLEEYEAIRTRLKAELQEVDNRIGELQDRRSTLLKALYGSSNEKYVGPTGKKAFPDPEFVEEIIRRRSALKLSAIQLSMKAGYSGAYLSMIEKGSRAASDEAKEKFRKTLDELENIMLVVPDDNSG